MGKRLPAGGRFCNYYSLTSQQAAGFSWKRGDPPKSQDFLGMELERRIRHLQNLSCSPGALLASFLSEYESKSKLVLISGPKGCGKTRWCLDLVGAAHSQGEKAAGLVSPGIFEGGRKIGIEVVNLANQERRVLAVLQTVPASMNSKAGFPPETSNWLFDQQALSWGGSVLDDLENPELLIIDELGRLEFLHGLGWQAGLRLLDLRNHHLACVVVRPSLLPAALQRWPWGQVRIMS